jgi:hypothetical protein
MTPIGWDQLGFGFVIEEKEDGTPWIKVVDPWYNRAAEEKAASGSTIALRLQPYASYTEAREIANFLNSRLFSGRTPILALREIG